jgi:hypothetical protein
LAYKQPTWSSWQFFSWPWSCSLVCIGCAKNYSVRIFQETRTCAWLWPSRCPYESVSLFVEGGGVLEDVCVNRPHSSQGLKDSRRKEIAINPLKTKLICFI